jgi:predicted O-methyltransferase YrrM
MMTAAMGHHDLTGWIDRLFADGTLTQMGHGQSKEDSNLGLGWLYYALARIVRPSVAVVIGSWRGFVPLVLARALADNQAGGRVIFIDPSLVDDFWKDPATVDAYFSRFGVDNITHYRLTTEQFVASDAYAELSDVGLVFIDGHHSYHHARFDFEAFEPKLSERGFILMHDSAALDLSTIYGLDKPYVYQVKLLVDELRQKPHLQVLEVPFADGVTVVTQAPAGPAGTNVPAVRDALKRGTDLFNLGRPKEAVGCFDEALALTVANETAWMLKGASLALLNEHDQAAHCFASAERLGHWQAPRAIEICQRASADRVGA